MIFVLFACGIGQVRLESPRDDPIDSHVTHLSNVLGFLKFQLIYKEQQSLFTCHSYHRHRRPIR